MLGAGLVLALVALTTGPAPFGPEESAAGDTGTRSYIVSFAADTSAAQRAEILGAVGAESVSSVPALSMAVVDVPALSEAEAVDGLRGDPGVVRVEADKTRAVEATPDDASYGEQWSLPQVGWDKAYGSVDPTGSSVVAVLDTGVDGGHPDLRANVVPGMSMLGGGDGTTDANGHGTAMAGIVAAEAGNGVGIAGIGFDGVSVLPVTVLSADGTGQDSDIISGVVWATDHGADVILMAFSSPSYSPSLQAALDYAWAHDVVLVAATGNDGTSAATYPAGDRGVVGVAGTDGDDALVASSNYGPAAFLAAPGTGILSTSAGGGYASVSGTSAAAATVAGAAALVGAVDEAAGNDAVVGRLARTADPAGSPEQTGNGRLNLARALSDTSDDGVTPAGVAGGSSGGPFVGPYLAAGNAAITGTVTNAATGQPIQGATVTCTTSGGCNNLVTATTDANGLYSLTVQFPGNGPTTVTVSAGATGFTAQSTSTTVTNTRNGSAGFALVPVPPANTAPVVDSVAISPAAPRTDTVLSAAVTSHDDQGHAVVYGYQWTKNGAAIPGATGSELDLSAAGNGDKGDLIRVQVVAIEAQPGGLSSAPVTSAAVTVANSAPEAAGVADRSVPELQPLTVDVNATDPDLDVVGYAITDGPGNASIDASTGVLSWTPTEQQGPGSFSFTVEVTDGETTDQVQFDVDVSEVNVAPVLEEIDDQAIDELAELSFTASASDADLPANGLSFSLVGAPSGATIGTTSGVFSWTPSETQGPGSYTFDVLVTDDGDGQLSDVETITVAVREVNTAPVLAAIPDTTVDEETEATFTASASDGDDPANTLAYSLEGEPEGAAIDPATGEFSWTPSESQGPASYTFSVVVDDGVDSDVRAVTITVDEVNVAPVLAAIGNRDADEESGLSFTAGATDHDLPANGLAYSLDGAPQGASIDAGSGVFTWLPTEAQGPGVYTFDVVVTDDGAPVQSDRETITIRVHEVNVAPVLEGIGDRTVDEQTELALTATGSDHDIPANSLAFSLVGAPSGATIDSASGAFSWTPTEAQGAGDYTFAVVVTDDGAGALSDSETITVHVNEVNRAPAAADDEAITDEDTSVVVSVLTNDSDPDESGGIADAIEVVGSSISVPAHGSAALVTSGPDAGTIRYTPEADWNGTDTVAYRVSDGEALSEPATATITVLPVNDAPVVTLAAGNNLGVDEGTQHTYAFSVSDVDAGDTFTAEAVSCGDGGAQVGTTSTSGTGGSFVCRFADGPVSSTVSVRVEDAAGAAGNTATQDVSVSNVAPTVTAPTIVVDPVTGVATLSTTYADPGVDTHTAHFQLTTVGASAPASFTTDKSAGGGVFTDTLVLPSGCYSSITVTAFVTDSDGDAGSASTTTDVVTDVYRAAWKDPIRDNERNVAKYGNVVPVKVLLSSSCTGTVVTSAQLFLTIAEGNVSDDRPDGTANVLVESVSSADTGNQMRLASGTYLYNLATKGLTQGKDYTLRVRSGSSTGPIILRALLQPKKG